MEYSTATWVQPYRLLKGIVARKKRGILAVQVSASVSLDLVLLFCRRIKLRFVNISLHSLVVSIAGSGRRGKERRGSWKGVRKKKMKRSVCCVSVREEGGTSKRESGQPVPPIWPLIIFSLGVYLKSRVYVNCLWTLQDLKEGKANIRAVITNIPAATPEVGLFSVWTMGATPTRYNFQKCVKQNFIYLHTLWNKIKLFWFIKWILLRFEKKVMLPHPVQYSLKP